jgi:hypothetical protein
MFQIRNLAVLLIPLVGVFSSQYAAAQSQPLNLRPGDVVIADTPQNMQRGAIRIYRANGTVDTVLQGQPLESPGGIFIDRDGAILVSSYLYDGSVKNGVFRLDPAGGPVTNLVTTPLIDNFALVRDTNGDIIVADGYRGLMRVHSDGSTEQYSPNSLNEIAMGVDLDFDGNILLACPPAADNQTTPGTISSVDESGARTILIQDANLIKSPNDLALAPDGSIMASNFTQYYPLTDQPRLVQIERSGIITELAVGGLLQKPKGVHVNEWGHILVADTDEQAILEFDPISGMQHLVWDMSDGVDDGNPVDRPFAVDQVPSLWLRTDREAVGGAQAQVSVSGISDYWGQPFALAISRVHGATPLNSIFPNSQRTSHLDLSRAILIHGQLPSNGADWSYSGFVPNSLAGSALHLQVFLPSHELLSNYVALPVL